MASQPVKGVIRTVKPLISVDKQEAKRRVIGLYKAWYRLIPDFVLMFHLPIPISRARTKLREAFMKNKNITDIRVIDMLVVKGQLELKEIVMGWKQSCHIMYMVKDSHLPKPNDFLSKFLAGKD